MAQIYKRQFTLNYFYGEEIFLVTNQDGKQTYVFYTIRGSNTATMGMFEVLMNEKLQDDKQLVIDYNELSVPSGDANNSGPIHLGGGNGILLTSFDKFSVFKGYTMCDYKSTVS